ncbi:hypothetical protein O3M35_011218 [Rhynocoris fuscipes]|uniref:Uncharacterized protein n=1 Tax=Rhynocoris fuscipes TaxID=488301 RepID=A0AAW1D0N0_9HEMI
MSSNDMPELGSKISLISKADIRYEGKLYAVDPQDCTIALANVKSFGTEDRKTANPVLAQKQTYDYILFRATDIKDISVVPAPQQLLYDPAIVQLSAPPNLGSRYGSAAPSAAGNAGTSAADPSSYSHPVLGNMGGHQTFSSAPGTGPTTTSGFNPMHSGLHNLARPSPSEFLHHHSNDLLTGSRSSTPALRKPSPTVDQATQANTQQQRRPTNTSPQHQHKDRNQSVYYRTGNRNQDNRNQGNMRNNQPSHQQQQRQRTFSQQRGDQQQQQGRGGWGGQQQQQRTGGGSGGGAGGIGGNTGNRQRSASGRVHQRGGGGANFSRAPGTGAARKTTTPLKFESDYDFDKANTEFEELFAKMKIGKAQDGVEGTVGAASTAVVNGQEKSKDDSGTENATGQDGEASTGDASTEQVVFYNKTKSFFDNISCEAVERSKGRSQRTDWRKERKLNSETFGVSSARRGMFGRGGPRGGGGGGYFYGRGAGGYFGSRGGGYRSGTGGIFKQQNKQPYRSQQQPQAAKA